MKKRPTVIDFEDEWSVRVERFFFRIPCRVEVDRLMSHVLLYNIETETEIRYDMDYDTTPHENIFRLEVEMVKAGWYPTLAEPVEVLRPYTVEEREALVRQGMSIERAFSLPGVSVPETIPWLIRRVDLPHNSLSAYRDDKRFYAEYPGRVSDFLKALRTKEMTPEAGWLALKSGALTKIVPYTESQRWATIAF